MEVTHINHHHDVCPRGRGLTCSIGLGTSDPEGSTGMSSYLSKLMPVLGPLNSSLGEGEGLRVGMPRSRAKSLAHFSTLSLAGSNTFQSTLRVGLVSPSSRLSPPSQRE